MDDCSDYKVGEELRRLADVTITHTQRRGVGFSRMHALRHATHRTVMFIDADIVLTYFTMSDLATKFAAFPRLAGVCGWYESSGRTNWNRALDLRRCVFYGKYQQNFTIFNHPDDGTFSGGFCVIRRDRIGTVRQQLHLRAGGEDIIFQAQLTALNYILGFDSTIRGNHDHYRGFIAAIRKAWSDSEGGIRVPFRCIRGGIAPPRIECFTGFPMLLVLALVWPRYAGPLLFIEFMPLLITIGIWRRSEAIMLFFYESIGMIGKVFHGTAYLFLHPATFKQRLQLLTFFFTSGVIAKYKWLKSTITYIEARNEIPLFDTSCPNRVPSE